MKSIITLKNINKSYKMGENSLHVLKNINFEVKKGDFISILGASGSGKSTLMNIIGCMDTCDDGEYFIEDLAIHKCNDSELAKVRNRNIGFIFQKYHLIPRYNILQNIMMPLLIRGVSRKNAESMAKESLKNVGLDDRIEHRPNELSGGQQQRVAIARALVTKPTILLADEPTGALDSNTGKEILALFKELNNAGNTIIIITHDANVAKESKKILQLDDGVLSKKFDFYGKQIL